MRIFYLLAAIMLLSCSEAAKKPENLSDAKILEIKGNVKSITQKVYKVKITEGKQERLGDDNGDSQMILVMGTGSLYGVHNVVNNKKESSKIVKEGGDYSQLTYPNFTEDCNFTINFNQSGDLISYTTYSYDQSFKTECLYHSNNYIKERHTYSLGGVYEKFSPNGFLQIESKYSDRGLITEDIYYGAVFNNSTRQAESSYIYSKKTFNYSGDKMSVSIESFDEFGNSLSKADESHTIDKNGNIIEEEEEMMMMVETSVEVIEDTTTESERYKNSKLSKGFRIYLDENDRFVDSEPVEHEMKEVLEYDQQGNWIEKRVDYLYKDGTVEYGDLLIVRDIQYY